MDSDLSIETQPTAEKLAIAEKKVRFLGVCFFLLFVCFTPAQSLITSLHPDIGYISISLLCQSCAVSGPSVV